jgi:methylenetetrahydrofolate dehydrogenase (NADP+)/methenyltetrahydrofolate cyclohydrolase
VALLIDGKAIAAKLRAELAREVARFQQRWGRAPRLDVVLAGADKTSAALVRSKEKAALELGMAGKIHELSVAAGEERLLKLIGHLNGDPTVDGILVQLPLPPAIASARIIESISPAKDVDGLHPANVAKLWSGEPGLVACTPRGILHLLREAGAKLEGARALVIGRSNLVGKPVAALLLAQNATVTIAHSKTRELARLCREADVVVAAVGRPKLVRADWIKPGAVVIDVGINRDESGKLCGDVDFASVEPIAGAITPVPGGVGPMTIAMLLDNTLRAAEARQAAESARQAQ